MILAPVVFENELSPRGCILLAASWLFEHDANKINKLKLLSAGDLFEVPGVKPSNIVRTHTHICICISIYIYVHTHI